MNQFWNVFFREMARFWWIVAALWIVTIAQATEKRLPGEPMITVIALYNGPGVPEGWIDSTTREDATDICNKLIANMSKEYATPIARARCIIKVQEK